MIARVRSSRGTSAVLTILLAHSSFAAEDSSAAGAYCPFPEPGQKPVCLTPAQERYPAFLSGADAGALDEAATAVVESDLAAPNGHHAYLALSSLAYAYYRLAQLEAANPGADPALVKRLERWNGLMSTVYHEAATAPALRGAVYEAASDLHARAPSVAAECDPRSSERCDTTSGLMLALRSADEFSETQGVRGALTRLLGRLLGREGSSEGRILGREGSSEGRILGREGSSEGRLLGRDASTSAP